VPLAFEGIDLPEAIIFRSVAAEGGFLGSAGFALWATLVAPWHEAGRLKVRLF